LGDIRESLVEEPPKNGEEPTRLLAGRELRDVWLLCDPRFDTAIGGLLATCRMLIGILLAGYVSEYADEALTLLCRFDSATVNHVLEFLRRTGDWLELAIHS
jgi:hypothetical protein